MGLPDHSVELFLSDIRRYLAIDITRAQGHGQSRRHIVLDRNRDSRVFAGRSHPHLRRAFMLKVAYTGLIDDSIGNQRQDNVRREPLLQM